MPTNAFIGKTKQPTDAELAAALGPAKSAWDKVIADLATEYGVAVQEWSSYSPKAGWSLRLKRDKRVILYLIPCEGCFMVGCVFGDKALKAAFESRLPERIVKVIKEAKRYAEGAGFRIDVTSVKEVAFIEKLAAIKLEK